MKERGANSETYGLLGRVYKDRWEAAVERGDEHLARGLLDRAIDAYRKGFETDWRDAYPGINAGTLMEIRDPPDPAQREILPVVEYSERGLEARGAKGRERTAHARPNSHRIPCLAWV